MLISEAVLSGITVIVGDAQNINVLKKARAYCADHVFAVCSDDNTNIAISKQVEKLRQQMKSNSRQVQCWLFIKDPETRYILKKNKLIEKESKADNFVINIGGIDVFDVTARLAFQNFPLDHTPVLENSDSIVKLIILGFGQMGESLAIQAIKIGHFANKKQIQIVIVDSDAKNKKAEFAKKFPAVDELCEISTIDLVPGNSDFISRLIMTDNLNLETEKNENKETTKSTDNAIYSVVVCFEDKKLNNNLFDANENLNFLIGTKIAEYFHNKTAQILACLSSSSGYTELLKPITGFDKIDSFGKIEDVFNQKVLLHEDQDIIAKLLHEAYVTSQKATWGVKYPCRPAHRDWDELDQFNKDSSRSSADHIEIKLRAVSCSTDSEKGNLFNLSGLTTEELLMLAEMEHTRWYAFMKLNGWSWGESRNVEKKIHELLKPWNELIDDDKKIDENFVLSISNCLKAVKKDIYR